MGQTNEIQNLTFEMEKERQQFDEELRQVRLQCESDKIQYRGKFDIQVEILK